MPRKKSNDNFVLPSDIFLPPVETIMGMYEGNLAPPESMEQFETFTVRMGHDEFNHIESEYTIAGILATLEYFQKNDVNMSPPTNIYFNNILLNIKDYYDSHFRLDESKKCSVMVGDVAYHFKNYDALISFIQGCITVSNIWYDNSVPVEKYITKIFCEGQELSL